ncbi:MAG: hypothetical protein ACO1OB_21105 [Archangium sp.]
MLTLLLLAAAPVTLPEGTERVVFSKQACAPKSSSVETVEVRDLGRNELSLIGVRPGTAQISFPCSATRIDVTVSRVETSKDVAEARLLLSAIPVAAVWRNNVGVQVHCPRCSGREWKRVEAVQGLFDRSVTSGPKRAPAVELISAVKAELTDFGSLTVDVSRDGFVVLYGAVKDEATRDDVLQRVKRFPSLGVDVTVAK